MLKKILLILLLLTVEFSTVREYFNDFKASVEVNDIEDNNEGEDSSTEIDIEKYFIASTLFQFSLTIFFPKTVVCDDVSSIISQHFKSIDSPPPQLF
ncbi:hypothetical protein EMA8858_01655 [Emticicia aquatica]|jgi:hypothetical protein|uniref:Uncharacterized protein n=1 Tax=Emticicia aquatica TaxID=1681835 RepID=A0ABM9AP42_9BACT|nr:hypothetical protein [Emticicia aquatica]CAH0995532.1 hypothetical protein EMA8858_01655 [Emticicia aquatica]